MVYIVILLIVIGVLWEMLGAIKEFIEEHWDVIWKLALAIGVGVVLGPPGIMVALILFGIYAIVKKNRDGKLKEKQVEQSTAIHNAKVNDTQIRHMNDMELKLALESNCKNLGIMDEQGWRRVLSNYTHKEYETSFDEITMNFAKQIEDQYIAKTASDWMQKFEEYISQRPGGCPIDKMLEEVDCDALRMTHITPTKKILEHYLNEGTRKISDDILPKFSISNTDNLVMYKPTKYLQHLYENKMNGYSVQGKQIETNADEDSDFADI